MRLGISTAQLRERKTELRNRLGPRRYAELTGTASRRRLSPRAKLFLGGMGLAAGTLGILLVIANVFAGEEGEEAPARPVSSESPTATALLPPSLVAVGGREYLDLGILIVSGSSDPGPVGTVFNRVGLASIELRATSYLATSAFATWEVVSASRTDAFLRGTFGDRQIDLSVYTQRPGGVLRPVAAGVGPLLEIDSANGYPFPATLILIATEGGRPVEARLRDDGSLLLATAPLGGGFVVDSYTGSALDVSAARPFGKLPTNVATTIRNGCNGAPPAPHPRAGTVSCRVAWSRANRGFTAPVEGTFSCAGPRSLRFEGGGVRLDFLLVGQFPIAFACEPSTVAAGENIVPDGEWVIVASIDGVGEVAIAVALDGQVFVGEIRGDAACPCLPRPT